MPLLRRPEYSGLLAVTMMPVIGFRQTGSVMFLNDPVLDHVATRCFNQV